MRLAYMIRARKSHNIYLYAVMAKTEFDSCSIEEIQLLSSHDLMVEGFLVSASYEWHREPKEAAGLKLCH